MALVNLRKKWNVSLIISACLFNISAYAQYSGGSGTVDDPYQIATAEDLIALGEITEDYDKYFILTANIDLDPNLPGRKVFDTAVVAPDTDSVNNNNFEGTSFAGVFDGGGNVIKNLSIDCAGANNDYLGLIGNVSYNGTIKNLGIENASIKGGDNSWYLGGLCGYNAGGRYDNDEGSINNCYTTGKVTGDRLVGGLCGYNNGSINNCYSTSIVENGDYIGGLCGSNYGSIVNCYSIGQVNSDGPLGGFCGSNSYGGVTNCFWDIETSGQIVSAGGRGLTTQEMMDPYWYSLNCWADNPSWVLDAGKDYPRLAWEQTTGQTIPRTSIHWLDGSGTSNDPYEINNSDQIIMITKASVLFDKHMCLSTDIDLTGLEMRPLNYYGGPFTGVFDGKRHKISNLKIDMPNEGDVGFFCRIGEEGIVKNLSIEDVNITGRTNVGSLCGINYGGSIVSCSSSGKVSGIYAVGGLVGTNLSSIVSKSHSSSTVKGSAWAAGGLVGWNYGGGKITDCYSTGRIAGHTEVGGLVGWIGSGRIVTCYSIGLVTGDENVGGLIGRNDSGNTISCFWDIETSGQVGSDSGRGLTTQEMMNPYWFGLNGWADNPNWVLEAGKDYPRLAWEKTSGQKIPQTTIDWIDGSGTDTDPYEITNSDQINMIGKATILLDKHFILSADIDLAGLQTKPIDYYGDSFTGVFDGNDHKIRNLTIDLPEETDVGFFGRLAEKGVIKNISIENVNVTGSSNVGSLCGFNYDGSIINCYSTGIINGERDLGGLCGSNGYDSSISNCYSTCSINGDNYLGGLCGDNNGSIINCYSKGTVNGNRYLGGFCGHNSGGIINCYSTGMVNGNDQVGGFCGTNWYSNIRNCFWDLETSGHIDSHNCTGLTTQEMMNIENFIKANWDFAGEVENGLHEIWQIPEDGGYPVLSYFNGYHPPVLLGDGTNESPYLISTAAELGSIIHQEQGVCYKLIQDLDLSGITWSLAIIPELEGIFDGNNLTISNLTITGHSDLALIGTIKGVGQVKNLGIVDANVVGTGDYIGTLVGENHGDVSNCYSTGSVSGSYYIGGLCGSNLAGTIADSYFDGSVVGTWSVGGIVGSHEFKHIEPDTYIEGLIINCHTKNGSVEGGVAVGGIAGYNAGGIIAACYAENSVMGGYYYDEFDNLIPAGIGGLVGQNEHGTIGNSYASGDVIGGAGIGGLVGVNGGENERSNGEIVNCYSTGSVWGLESSGGLVGFNQRGVIKASFWDTETSGQINMCGTQEDPATGSDDSFGKTTTEMQDPDTFMEAGWDFDRPIWMIEGQNYPQLVWEWPNHIFRIIIATGYDYRDPDNPNDTEYAFHFEVLTDETVEAVEFQTPIGALVEILKIYQEEVFEGGLIEREREYEVEDCAYGWRYQAEFNNSDSLDAFNEGNYIIIVYYDDGSQERITVWFGIPDSDDTIPQPVQKPAFTSFEHQQFLPSPVTIEWEPPVNPEVNWIQLVLENQGIEEYIYGFDGNTKSLVEPIPLRQGQWEAGLMFGIRYIQNIKGIEVWCVKVSSCDYEFTVVP